MLIESLQKRLLQQNSQSLRRERKIVVVQEADNRILVNGELCIDFSNNDYLGLKRHPGIIEAFIQSAHKHGVGSGASAFISGYSDEHAETEHEFARWLGMDRAILFNSGYCANIGIISAFMGRADTILSDKLCHASLLDGIILSRAKHHRYQHCNVKHAYHLAESYPPHMIVTESIFSMEGSLAPIHSSVELAKQYQALLLIDDAHGIGILGETGAGVAEHFKVNQQSSCCLVLPLGKAFNAMGAIVAGQKDIIETILQFSRSYRYTTAIPPAICSAIRAALKIIQMETWRRNRLMANIRFFITYALGKGLNLISHDETPIKSILVRDNAKLLKLQNLLLSKGFYVPAIRPPTVPNDKARVRISLNSLHTQDEIMLLIDHIAAGLATC